jgi:integrin alpha FG-GAP repeat containing protein 1
MHPYPICVDFSFSDVFLVCENGHGGKYYQIWVNNKDKGFSLAQQENLPSGVQSISFADIGALFKICSSFANSYLDRDGTIDMVFSTCDSVSGSSGIGSNCYINIAFNQQLPLCSTTEASFSKGVRTCRPPDDLCISDPNFKYDLSNTVRFPLSALFPNGPAPSLLVQDTSFSPSIPIALKLGDVNLDGYPDMLLIVASSTSQARTPKMIYSVPCAHGIAGCDGAGNGRRGWQVATKGVASLDAVQDARDISFVDMDEDVLRSTLLSGYSN